MKVKISILILLIPGCFLAQTEFSKIYQQEKIALTYTESLWMNDTLVVAGSYIDSFGKFECILNFFNSQGELILANDEIDTSLKYSYNFFSKGLSLFHDTILHFGYKVMFSDSLENRDKLSGVFTKIDKSGNVRFVSDLRGKYYPNEHFARPNDFKIIDNKIFMTYLTYDDSNGALNNGQICITQLDLNGIVAWDECYGNDSRENSNQILTSSKGDILVIGDSHNLYYMSDFQGSGNGFWHGYIFLVDSMGNLKWEWRSPSEHESANAAVMIDDSTVVVAAGYGIEYCDVPDEPLSWCSIYWTGGAYKMNLKTRNKIWETSLSAGPHTTKRDNQYYDIIPSIEKDGYILCGSGYNLAYEGCQQIDTQKCWSFPGVIAKVSNEGDSLWLRKYFGVTDIWESNIFFDIEATDDSFYSLVGEAFNPFPGETQGTHGWVVITDKYGCLVPGCHLISSTQESEERNELLKSPMKIYPNPVANQINVLITGDVSAKTELKLFNSMGIELDSWSDLQKEGTYLIPANQYAPGSYYMLLVEENRVLATQEIIKLD